MQKGFTLIELIIVIVILGILSVLAAPRFIDISTDARIAQIESLRATLDEANKRVMSMSSLPGRKIPIDASNPNTQFYFDVNANGTIDADSNSDQFTVEGKDGIDILLLSDGMIDNHQILKLLAGDTDFEVEFTGNRHQIYIGFSQGQLGVRNGNCRVYYDQNSFQMRTDGC